MHIGNTIKQLRQTCKLTQEQLANGLGVSVSAVSQWETQRTMPDISLLVPMAHIFGISVDELLGMERESIELTVKERTCQSNEYLRSGEKERALALAADTYREFPNHLSAIGMYAWMLNTAADADHPERWEESIRMSQKILNRQTNGKECIAAVYRICQCYGKLGELSQALEYARQLPRSAMMNEPYMLCKFGLCELMDEDMLKQVHCVVQMLEDYTRQLLSTGTLPSEEKQYHIARLLQKIKKIQRLLEEVQK